MRVLVCAVFFFQAEDGIRDLVRSRGLGDVYKRQEALHAQAGESFDGVVGRDVRLGRPDPGLYRLPVLGTRLREIQAETASLPRCLLYTSDAADERSSVDLGGRRIITKKKYRLR